MNLNPHYWHPWQSWKQKGVHVFDVPALPTVWLLPLSFFALAIWFDTFYLAFTGSGWAKASYAMLTLGLVGSLLSVPLVWLELRGLAKTDTGKRAGGWFLGTELLVVLLFAASWLVRHHRISDPNYIAMTYSYLAAFALVGAAWFGGEFTQWVEEQFTR